MKIHGKIGFADFQEDDIQLPGFYTYIPPSEFETSAPHQTQTGTPSRPPPLLNILIDYGAPMRKMMVVSKFGR